MMSCKPPTYEHHNCQVYLFSSNTILMKNNLQCFRNINERQVFLKANLLLYFLFVQYKETYKLFLRNVILPCLYLKILYRIHFSNPILNEYPDFCQILHEVKKAKLLQYTHSHNSTRISSCNSHCLNHRLILSQQGCMKIPYKDGQRCNINPEMHFCVRHFKKCTYTPCNKEGGSLVHSGCKNDGLLLCFGFRMKYQLSLGLL